MIWEVQKARERFKRRWGVCGQCIVRQMLHRLFKIRRLDVFAQSKSKNKTLPRSYF